MKMTLWDVVKIRLLVYAQLPRLASWKQAIRLLLNPIDPVREFEFSYILNYLRKNNIRTAQVLDVSSPYVLSYILSARGTVIKTDINPAEKGMIRQGDTLKFMIEDATRLSFADNTFDFVYSISVIEHIHEKYCDAVNEMLRVLKPGGYLYLTAPVASEHAEEWLDHKAYPEQAGKEGKYFFQYRFSEGDIRMLLNSLPDAEVLNTSIYWEKKAGGYDDLMKKLQAVPSLTKLASLRRGIISLSASFTLLDFQPGDFTNAKPFGNISIVIKKRIH